MEQKAHIYSFPGKAHADLRVLGSLRSIARGRPRKRRSSIKTSSQEGGEVPFTLQLKHGEAISPDI